MRFGIALGPTFPPGASMHEAVSFITRQAETAHANNFQALFAGYHYLAGPEAAMVEPLSLLSFLTGKFPGMHVGTAIYLLPLSPVVEVAERTATLDALSGGRFIFGVGQGYREKEFASFGVPMKQRRSRMVEGLQLVRRLWSEEHVTFEGKYTQVRDVTLSTRPVQQPGPPVLIGADRVETVSNIPGLDAEWLVSPRHSVPFVREVIPHYRSAMDAAGREYRGLWVCRELCVAGTREAAMERMRAGLQHSYELYRAWRQPGETYSEDPDRLAGGRVMVGSPEDVAAQISELHREFQVNAMWFRVYWPGMDPAHALETIELFGREVIPQVAGATAQSRP